MIWPWSTSPDPYCLASWTLHTLVHLPFSPATQTYSHLRTTLLAASSDENSLRLSSHEPCHSNHSGHSFRASSSESLSWPLSWKYFPLLLCLQSALFLYMEIIPIWHHVVFSFAYCLSPLTGLETERWQDFSFFILDSPVLRTVLYVNKCLVIIHAE